METKGEIGKNSFPNFKFYSDIALTILFIWGVRGMITIYHKELMKEMDPAHSLLKT